MSSGVCSASLCTARSRFQRLRVGWVSPLPNFSRQRLVVSVWESLSSSHHWAIWLRCSSVNWVRDGRRPVCEGQSSCVIWICESAGVSTGNWFGIESPPNPDSFSPGRRGSALFVLVLLFVFILVLVCFGLFR